MSELIPIERIENRIFMIRGQKVMLDRDLAEFYQVETFVLNQAVKRNIYRFPADFMFRLTEAEAKRLTSQIVISNRTAGKTGRGGRRTPPYVFTEQGVAMLSSILRSRRAVEINIAIMRAFIRLRQILSSHARLARRVEELEHKYGKHEIEITSVFKLLKKLMGPPPDKPAKRIGFVTGKA